MYVLPGILSVEQVVVLPMEVLTEFTKVSTDIIIRKVNKWVDANITSGNADIRTAAEKLKQAYAEVNYANEFLKSAKAKEMATTLNSLQLSDVSAFTDVYTLKNYRLVIIELLSEDPEFLSTYKNEISKSETAGLKSGYTAKMDEDNISLHCIRMQNIVIEDSAVANARGQLLDTIMSNESLFKNCKYQQSNPTVFRAATYKKEKLTNILRGLDFLIPKLEKNIDPRVWRTI